MSIISFDEMIKIKKKLKIEAEKKEEEKQKKISFNDSVFFEMETVKDKMIEKLQLLFQLKTQKIIEDEIEQFMNDPSETKIEIRIPEIVKYSSLRNIERELLIKYPKLYFKVWSSDSGNDFEISVR